STLGALGAGTAYGVRELLADDVAGARVADLGPDAGELIDEQPAITVAPASVEVAPAVVAPEVERDEAQPAWMAIGDEAALAPLRSGTVVKVKFNRGGTSLSLRIDFDNGARAAFKPEQVHPQSNPRREIAAYRIDRLLGINRVPPATGRTFTVAEIVAAVPPSERFKRSRLDEEAIARKGKLRGEVSWWVPVLDGARIGGFGIDETGGIVTWKKALRVGATVPEKDRWLVRQISNVIAFDFLLDNTDRWSGNNAQVGEGADAKVLYFTDNTLALTGNRKAHRKNRTYLSRVETFSRRLIGRIRALTEAELRAAVEVDPEPFDFLMTDKEIDALMGRRDKLLEYVDALIAEHGEEKVLAFP
ncbi:MAG: hypothetical protein ACREI7_08375, partial [Myxococcota bacterium]